MYVALLISRSLKAPLAQLHQEGLPPPHRFSSTWMTSPRQRLRRRTCGSTDVVSSSRPYLWILVIYGI